MKRTTVFLPESLERDLQGYARRAGKPMASVVREALEAYVVSRRESGSRLSFVACGAGARTDVAERHEQLLWATPHEHEASETRKPRARKKR